MGYRVAAVRTASKVRIPRPRGAHSPDSVGRSPLGAIVPVVTNGDDDLLDCARRQPRHFPQDGDGGYAGHHPWDAEVCINEIEWLRSKGAEFLLLPSTMPWWLEYYEALGEHLSVRYQRVKCDHDSCALFDLRPDRGARDAAVASAQWHKPQGGS